MATVPASVQEAATLILLTTLDAQTWIERSMDSAGNDDWWARFERQLREPLPDTGEEEPELDPEYQLLYKQAAENLQAMDSVRSLIWTREQVSDEFEGEELLAVDMFDLLKACRSLFAAPREDTGEQEEKVYRLFSRLSQFIKQLRATGLASGEVSRCNQYLSKGRQALVDGRMRPDPNTGAPRLWQRQDGTYGSSYEISAFNVRFLGGRGETGFADLPSAPDAADIDAEGIPF